MEEIRFLAKPYRDGDRSGGIRLFVNGQNFADLVREQELRFATAEGSPSIAGAYAGLPPSPDVLPPSGHFLGRPTAALYDFDERVQILGCECGEPGCWPLVCRIQVTDERVTWSDFEQPHRSPSSNRHWSYEDFGPFTFDRRQYEAALAAMGSRGAS